jgi:AraC-like DNA-binding protein
MTELICYIFTCAGLFLMAFIAFLNPAKVNDIANRWFGLFLFSVGCLLLETILYSFAPAGNYSSLIVFTELSRFAMAPALYLSVRHFTSPDKTFRKQEYLHFIPFAFFFVFVAPGIFHMQVHILPISASAVFGRFFGRLTFFSVKIQMVVYWTACYSLLIRHQKNIRLTNSSLKPINLDWLRFLLLAVIGGVFLWFNESFLHIAALSALVPFGCVAMLVLISYFLLAQKEIYPFEEPELEEIGLLIQSSPQSSETKERLSDGQVAALKSSLILLMESEKAYLDNELSLPQLAKLMEVSTHDLSYVLNQGFGKNFFQFVNAYRVQEAKELMLSGKHKHLNLLGIAYSSGFNSKTTFNSSFKKETGLSPTQFLQQGESETIPALPQTRTVG